MSWTFGEFASAIASSPAFFSEFAAIAVWPPAVSGRIRAILTPPRLPGAERHRRRLLETGKAATEQARDQERQTAGERRAGVGSEGHLKGIRFRSSNALIGSSAPQPAHTPDISAPLPHLPLRFPLREIPIRASRAGATSILPWPFVSGTLPGVGAAPDFAPAAYSKAFSRAIAIRIMRNAVREGRSRGSGRSQNCRAGICRRSQSPEVDSPEAFSREAASRRAVAPCLPRLPAAPAARASYRRHAHRQSRAM